MENLLIDGLGLDFVLNLIKAAIYIDIFFFFVVLFVLLIVVSESNVDL